MFVSLLGIDATTVTGNQSYGKFFRTGIPFTPLTTIGSAKRQASIVRVGSGSL